MEGELVFYDQAEIDAWSPRPRKDWREADTSSTLGKLYAEWNAGNRRSIDEYDRRIVAMRRYEKARGLWDSNGDDPGARTSPAV